MHFLKAVSFLLIRGPTLSTSSINNLGGTLRKLWYPLSSSLCSSCRSCSYCPKRGRRSSQGLTQTVLLLAILRCLRRIRIRMATAMPTLRMSCAWTAGMCWSKTCLSILKSWNLMKIVCPPPLFIYAEHFCIYGIVIKSLHSQCLLYDRYTYALNSLCTRNDRCTLSSVATTVIVN